MSYQGTLPNGLEFVSAQIGNDNISETKQNILDVLTINVTFQ